MRPHNGTHLHPSPMLCSSRLRQTPPRIIEFKASTNPDDTGLCAAYHPSDDRVYYNLGLVQRAQNNVADGATVFAHELGHFLGMNEAGTNPSQSTIMNNPVVGPTTTCPS